MDRKERLTLIQLALGKVSVDFMRQSADVVMPTAELLETASQIEEAWHAEIARLTAERDEAKAVAVWAATNLVWFDPNICPFLDEADISDADIYRQMAALVEAMKGGGGMDWDEYHGFLRPMTDEEKRVREGGMDPEYWVDEGGNVCTYVRLEGPVTLDECEIVQRLNALAAAQARIEELERMVVWAVNNSAFVDRVGFDTPTLAYYPDAEIDCIFVDCDGTPASILAAVEKAMGES